MVLRFQVSKNLRAFYRMGSLLLFFHTIFASDTTWNKILKVTVEYDTMRMLFEGYKLLYFLLFIMS